MNKKILPLRLFHILENSRNALSLLLSLIRLEALAIRVMSPRMRNIAMLDFYATAAEYERLKWAKGDGLLWVYLDLKNKYL